MLCLRQKRRTRRISSSEYTVPVGLFGFVNTSIFTFWPLAPASLKAFSKISSEMT